MGDAPQNQSSGDDTKSSITDHYEMTPAPVELSFWKENYAPNHGKPHTTFYGGPLTGRRKYPHSKQQKDYVEHHPEGGLFPPISQSLSPEAEVLKDSNTKVQESLKLPQIIEEPSKIPQRKRRRQATDPPKELLVIPLLVHFENQKINQGEQTEMDENAKNGIYHSNYNEEPADRKSMSEEDLNEEQVDPMSTCEVSTAVAESRFKTLQMDIDWNLDANSDEDLLAPEAPPVGSLPPINGKKRPGNQSSMTNVKASNASYSAAAIDSKGLPTGIIRGSLPEELKECCKGSSVGSLIMGPDGEIVCLSLMGATRDADIPIRFDFMPELEEEEQDNYNPSSLLNPANSSESVSAPFCRRGKKGKLKNLISETSLQGENAERSAQEFGQHRITEKIHKEDKGDDRSGQKKDKQKKLTENSDQWGEDIGERNEMTRSPEQEVQFDSEEIGPENGDEASSISTGDFQDQSIEEEGTSDQNMQLKSDQEKQKMHGTEQQINVHGTEKRIKNGHETDQQTKKENHQPSSGSRKQPNLKHKTSGITKTQNPKPSGKSGNNPEIFKDVEKVFSESNENSTANPEQIQIAQESNDIEKQQLTEEEELALLQEITNSVTKATTKGKGKKKAKGEKVQKPEKAQASPARKVKQKAGAEQGKAAFLVGLPKNKKGESKILYPKKPSEQVEIEETVHEAQEKPEEIEEEEDNYTEKESEDSYVVIEYHERTPTPPQSKDIHSESDPTPKTSNQISGQITATLEVPSQDNEDDYYSSGMSEVTSSSVRQRRSSRALEISEKAERRRLEVERKRREREEQLRLEKEQQERQDKMKEDLEQEQLRRAQEIRVRKQEEEEEKQRQEEERASKMQLEQQALERARQQQEEHRRKLQEIQRRKQEEELERIEFERQRQREQEHLEAEERLQLLEMAAEEREEYLRKKREKEEQDRREAEERRLKAEKEARAIMEEAQRQAQLLAMQTAALEQQLQFNRGLLKESVGMDQTQGISRPWVFSYFEILELLGIPLPVEGE